MSPGRWRCSARRTNWSPPSPTLASSSPALLPFVQRKGKPSSLIRGGEKQLHELSWVKSVKQNSGNMLKFQAIDHFCGLFWICRHWQHLPRRQKAWSTFFTHSFGKNVKEQSFKLTTMIMTVHKHIFIVLNGFTFFVIATDSRRTWAPCCGRHWERSSAGFIKLPLTNYWKNNNNRVITKRWHSLVWLINDLCGVFANLQVLKTDGSLVAVLGVRP